jgi:phospholipase C
MNTSDRRTFLKLLGAPAVAAALPLDLSRALAIPAWSTYPERLERAGISWKIYQDVGVGLDAAGFWGWTEDPYIGNYGDNSLLYFHQYQNALPDSPLARKAKTGTNILSMNREPARLMDIFRDDVAKGRLPQVSWIVAPEAYCEHPNWEPDFGSWYVSQVVDILASNPEVWSKMALFITYDEEGGFFDHLVPPTPPQSRAEGLSTVEITNEIFPGDSDHPSGPYGLGIRVPMLIVSPWTPRRMGELGGLRSHLDDSFSRGTIRAPSSRSDRNQHHTVAPRRRRGSDVGLRFQISKHVAPHRLAQHRRVQA